MSMHSGEDISLVVRPKAARRLLGGCSAETLYELLNRGALSSFREGRSRLIVRASIDHYIARKLDEAARDNGLGNGRTWQRGMKAAAAAGLPPAQSDSPTGATTPAPVKRKRAGGPLDPATSR